MARLGTVSPSSPLSSLNTGRAVVWLNLFEPNLPHERELQMTSLFKVQMPLIAVGLMALGCVAAPDKTAIVGRWTADVGSNSSPASSSARSRTGVEFFENGTFGATSVSGEILSKEQPWPKKLITGSGVWDLGSPDSGSPINLTFQAVSDPAWTALPVLSQLFPEKQIFEPPQLMFFRGDPDNREGIRFVKEGQ